VIVSSQVGVSLEYFVMVSVICEGKVHVVPTGKAGFMMLLPVSASPTRQKLLHSILGLEQN